jgi:hypothetical protein
VLSKVGFSKDMQQQPIVSLSGGWKMKLALGACVWKREGGSSFPRKFLPRKQQLFCFILGVAAALALPCWPCKQVGQSDSCT